ncbi:sigma factor-like helix-turn-helix DNA-binding protein [Shewanella sp.]|uniref:sigma factor-like helix-turn-helix DNA-binding protein n=1 Tax=Shewanella sp. TaxID=50422 RepID=UPI004054089E
MAELEGVSQQEIANLLGLSLSGAKSRIQRGRVKFRQQMMACCDLELAQEGIVDYSPKSSNKGVRCQ